MDVANQRSPEKPWPVAVRTPLPSDLGCLNQAFEVIFMLILWLILFFAGRVWLARRARELQKSRGPSDPGFAIWLACLWGWGWRSLLWFFIPGGILFFFATSGDYNQAGYSIGIWFGAWITAMVLSLDAPCWFLRKTATATYSAMATHDSAIYEKIAEEFRLGTYNQGLWLSPGRSLMG